MFELQVRTVFGDPFRLIEFLKLRPRANNQQLFALPISTVFIAFEDFRNRLDGAMHLF